MGQSFCLRFKKKIMQWSRWMICRFAPDSHGSGHYQRGQQIDKLCIRLLHEEPHMISLTLAGHPSTATSLPVGSTIAAVVSLLLRHVPLHFTQLIGIPTSQPFKHFGSALAFFHWQVPPTNQKQRGYTMHIACNKISTLGSSRIEKFTI
jgi:hypothetical protein